MNEDRDIIGEINGRAQEIVGTQGVPFSDVLCLIGAINKRLGRDRVRFTKKTEKLIRSTMRLCIIRKGEESCTGDWVRAWMDRQWNNASVDHCQEFIWRLCDAMEDNTRSLEERAVERRALVPVTLKSGRRS